MAGRAEYKKWSNYWNILFDKKSPENLKKAILKLSSDKLIFAVEEILLNLKYKKIDINRGTKRKIFKYKDLAQKLANPSIAVNKKRQLLQTKEGLGFVSSVLSSVIAELQQQETPEYE
jgi:hypothetical protein